MNELRRTIRRVAAWIDAREVRERACLLAAALVAVGGGLVVGVLDPASERSAQASARERSITTELAGVDAQIEALLAESRHDPNAALAARRDELTRQNEGLDARIEAHALAMVPPAEIPSFLGEVLGEQRGLGLVRLENLGAEPLVADGGASDLADDLRAGAGVYRHDFEIVVRGGYLETLAYLRELEALPWSFFWEELEYEVVDYPKGRTRIRAWTLGAGEEWLGV